MELINDLIIAAQERPGALFVCIAVAVVLALVFKGDGTYYGDSDCEGDGGD